MKRHRSAEVDRIECPYLGRVNRCGGSEARAGDVHQPDVCEELLDVRLEAVQLPESAEFNGQDLARPLLLITRESRSDHRGVRLCQQNPPERRRVDVETRHQPG